MSESRGQIFRGALQSTSGAPLEGHRPAAHDDLAPEAVGSPWSPFSAHSQLGTPTTAPHTHTGLYCQNRQCIRIWGSTRQLASPVKALTVDSSLVTVTHAHLHCSLQFHRKCELSTLCDGGDLRDHILLPTSICPVTRVSVTAHQGLANPPLSMHISGVGSTRTFAYLRGLPQQLLEFGFSAQI